MTNSTTQIYILKRDTINFSDKISKQLSQPDRKFIADMIYEIFEVKTFEKGKKNTLR